MNYKYDFNIYERADIKALSTSAVDLKNIQPPVITDNKNNLYIFTQFNYEFSGRPGLILYRPYRPKESIILTTDVPEEPLTGIKGPVVFINTDWFINNPFLQGILNKYIFSMAGYLTTKVDDIEYLMYEIEPKNIAYFKKELLL